MLIAIIATADLVVAWVGIVTATPVVREINPNAAGAGAGGTLVEINSASEMSLAGAANIAAQTHMPWVAAPSVEMSVEVRNR